MNAVLENSVGDVLQDRQNSEPEAASGTATTRATPDALTYADLEPSVVAACGRIAPTWPLDQFIAVNPYWGFVGQPIEQAARRLGKYAASPMVMRRTFYLAHWQAGRLTRAHFQSAIDASRTNCTVGDLVEGLTALPPVQPRQALVTGAVDAQRDLSHAMPWVDFVTHQISQHCAAYFDVSQAAWNPERDAGLYASWRAQATHDHSAALLMGYMQFGQHAASLPVDPHQLIAAAAHALGFDEAAQPEQTADYFTALLMSINGWASWCAYERWQARLGTHPGKPDDDTIIELLAIRLAWEWLLFKHPTHTHNAPEIVAACAGKTNAISEFDIENTHNWLLQTALEIAHQQPLCHGLMNAPRAAPVKTLSLPASPARPSVQAIFCIDVRSEVFRRALEAASPTIQTRGFAGFFGLFISYSPIGTALNRPQLPGLLAPVRCVTDESDSISLGQALAQRRKQGLQWRKTWTDLRQSASSGFTFVESFGLLYAGKLLKNTLVSATSPLTVEQTGLSVDDVTCIRPRLQNMTGVSAAAELQSRCDMAAGILGAIGLTKDFARIVLLAGHGSQTANNPHAAGLDCGACGGQTGEVNARVLAALLNDPALRGALLAKEINVPQTTWFVGGLHNTTTDELGLYDTDLLPESHRPDLRKLEADLLGAGRRARAERAPSLGLAHLCKNSNELAHRIKTRANDWAQVRPEWGLANNAAFIVAPRSRSQHLDLAGRAFLHDYDHAQDPDLGVLTLIMTAPMVVTNWINMQYYASVVDNVKYGSGNKVLHNVVGGRLGVFEGNGGDLRIGLPMQSLHDGKNWQHIPLRLSVFIEAPQAAIDSILAKHAVVKNLVVNQWLHLFQMQLADDGQLIISKYQRGQWLGVSS